jgi:hypothetical protein
MASRLSSGDDAIRDGDDFSARMLPEGRSQTTWRCTRDAAAKGHVLENDAVAIFSYSCRLTPKTMTILLALVAFAL